MRQPMKKNVAAPKNQYTNTFFCFDDEPASPKSQSDDNQKESIDALPTDTPTEKATPQKETQQNKSPKSSASNSPEPTDALFEFDEELTLAKISLKKSLAESAAKETHSQPKQLPPNGVNGSSLPAGFPIVASQSQKIDRAQKSTRSATSAPVDFGVSTPWDRQKVSRANGSLKLSQLHAPTNKTDGYEDVDDSSSLSL